MEMARPDIRPIWRGSERECLDSMVRRTQNWVL
jgi:hypothetical protein